MKYTSRILVFITLFQVIFCCVPRKKLIYLRDKEKEPRQVLSSPEKEYQLKSEDVISVHIFSLTPGQFDIFASSGDGQNSVSLFTIDRAGYVELPAIGEVLVSGLTIKKAQDKIRILLEDYLRSPLVRITLQTPFEFTVLGEVSSAGRYTLVGEEITILEALGTAGDLTRFADRAHIKVMRKHADGETEIAYVNVLEDDFLTSNYYYLQSEDVVIVDPLRARSVRENQLYFISSLIGAISSITFVLINLTRISQ